MAWCKKDVLSIDLIEKSDPQEYWKYWKNHRKRPNTTPGISAINFTTYFTKSDMPTEGQGSEFIQNITKLIDRYGDAFEIEINSTIVDILNVPVHLDEIQMSRWKLKTNKAPGIDLIQAEFYKYSDGILDKSLLFLFNSVMNAGEYPSSWCEGVVNPIYKQNSRLDPENYRKITITCALGKSFEIILNNRLTHAKKILQKEDPHQFGLKEKSRAIDCAFILNGVIDICAGRKRPLYACFVNFRSAFDKVNHHALMYKMLEQGIRGNFFNVVKSMFDNAKSRVKWGNALGKIFRNMHGVLQGAVISPTLLKIFLEDLCLYLDPENGIMAHNVRVSYLLFADDLVLFSESKSGVQKLLYGLQNFCQRWQMTVNLNKTKLCIFNEKYCINDNSGPILFNNNRYVKNIPTWVSLSLWVRIDLRPISQRNEIKHWMLYLLREKPCTKLWVHNKACTYNSKFSILKFNRYSTMARKFGIPGNKLTNLRLCIFAISSDLLESKYRFQH